MNQTRFAYVQIGANDYKALADFYERHWDLPFAKITHGWMEKKASALQHLALKQELHRYSALFLHRKAAAQTLTMPALPIPAMKQTM